MSFTESVKTCFSKFVTFKGRATRSEYWWFVLCTNVLVNLLPLLVFALFNAEAMLFAYVATVFAVTLPLWSVTVRRLHDTNHSGWWMLCPVYPIILMFMKGSEGENNYGASESQLPCPICSELVDASVSVCPHCGEATHFDFVEPASGTDKKVAIGVLALCGLLLVGGIAFSFSGGSTGIGGGYDLNEDEYDLLIADSAEVDDMDYQENSGNSAINEELGNFESFMGQTIEWAKDDATQFGEFGPTTLKAISECMIIRDNLKDKSMTPTQRQRFNEINERLEILVEAMEE